MKQSMMVLTKTDKMVVRILVCVILVTAALIGLASCSADDTGGYQTSQPEPTQVILSFSPYQMQAMSRSNGPTTRAATAIDSIVTRLDVWIISSGDTIAVHRRKEDGDLSSISVTLDKRKTYALYAAGHKAADAATLRDSVITFPDNKVTQAMYCSKTFTPSETSTIACQMRRIVAMFRFETTDTPPTEVRKMAFEIDNIPQRWHVAGHGAESANRVSTFNNFSRMDDGTAAFSLYCITADEQTLHIITVTAYDAADNIVQQRTFSDVPLRNGYKTTYRGDFFINRTATSTFTIESDRQEYDVTNF